MNSLNVALPILSVIAIYAARIVELKTKRDTVAGPIRERVTLRLFMLTGTLMIAGSIVEFFVRDLKLNWINFCLGWACSLASIALRRRAITALGRF